MRQKITFFGGGGLGVDFCLRATSCDVIDSVFAFVAVASASTMRKMCSQRAHRKKRDDAAKNASDQRRRRRDVALTQEGR